MSNIISIKHKIQRYIIDYLRIHEIARFSELRPRGVDTNLFTYHLTVLLKSGVIAKAERGYVLGAPGLAYLERLTDDHLYPKVIVMLLIQNSDGDVLLERRNEQPYVNTWTLPHGKVHIDDGSLGSVAARIAKEKLALETQTTPHVGDCYVRVLGDSREIITSTLVHVFRFDSDVIQTSENLIWARPHKLTQYRLAPAVERIMTRGFFNDPFFFEEYDVDWYN